MCLPAALNTAQLATTFCLDNTLLFLLLSPLWTIVQLFFIIWRQSERSTPLVMRGDRWGNWTSLFSASNFQLASMIPWTSIFHQISWQPHLSVRTCRWKRCSFEECILHLCSNDCGFEYGEADFFSISHYLNKILKRSTAASTPRACYFERGSHNFNGDINHFNRSQRPVTRAITYLPFLEKWWLLHRSIVTDWSTGCIWKPVCSFLPESPSYRLGGWPSFA